MLITMIMTKVPTRGRRSRCGDHVWTGWSRLESLAAGRAGGRVMDERCSSYVDFAVKGMMNESRRGGVRVSTSQRGTEWGAHERTNERSPIREEMKRSRSYTAVNWTTSRIRMTDDCRPLTKPHGRSGEYAENTRDVGSLVPLKSRAVSSTWQLCSSLRYFEGWLMLHLSEKSQLFRSASRFFYKIVCWNRSEIV